MKNLFLLIILIFTFNGCATWKGIKKDSNDAWKATKDGSSKIYKETKETIHKVTE
nr:hypothetical protein [Malaciobacter halophilus]